MDGRWSVARRYGERWSAGAAVRAERFAELSRPAWLAVATAADIGPGTRVLDVGCGSGEFARLAVDRGATVAGIDAAAQMIELARGLVREADLRIGSLERLPWADDTFDVVTGFNAFQFAPDLTAALAEAARVCRPAGRVAVCNWGPVVDCDLITLVRALDHLQPGPTLVPRRPLGEPGVLEELVCAAGLRPGHGALVSVPYQAPDPATLTRDVLSAGNTRPAVEHSGREVVGRMLLHAAAPFRRSDGSYLLSNTFRYLICRPAAAPWAART